MNRKLKTLALIHAAALITGSCFNPAFGDGMSTARQTDLATVQAPTAVIASANPDDTDWTAFIAPRSTGAVLTPTTAEGGFSAPDRAKQGYQIQNHVFDQICSQVQIPINYDFGRGDFSGSSLDVKRYLNKDVDNTFVLIDDAKINVSLFHPFSRAIGDGGAAAGLSFGATIEGHSLVIRRTGSAKSCDEIKRLFDLRDIKTVLPMTGPRIAKMGLGELWRIPLTLTYSEGASLSDASPADGAAVTVSFVRTDDGTSSMTLYRIADDKVRFRFRIDHVIVHSQSLGLTDIYPAQVFVANAANILLRFVEQQAADQIQRYYSAWLTFGRADSDGKKIMMEFIIDPRDPQQAEALAKAVRGDFRELAKMAAKMSSLQTKSTMSDYLALRQYDAHSLGPSSYAASDVYSSKMKSFSLNLPIFIAHNATALFGEENIDRYTGTEGEFHFYRADKSKTNSYLDMPWLGPLVKDNSERDAEAVTFAPKDGQAGEPILIYIRNKGFYRESVSSARKPIQEINAVLNLVGAQSGSSSSRLELPLDRLVPPPAPRVIPAGRDQFGAPRYPADRKGMISITLVFNQEAIKDILTTSAVKVLRAFAASIGADDRPLADWLIRNAKVVADGRLDYDWRRARHDFPEGPHEQFNERTNKLASLSRQAAGLLADLAAGRNAPSNVERAQDVARLIGGGGKSGLAYEDVLRVLVQLINPLDISGDIVATVESTSKEVSSKNNHLVLKNGRPEIPNLKAAGDAKSRFAEPSILTD